MTMMKKTMPAVARFLAALALLQVSLATDFYQLLGISRDATHKGNDRGKVC
jgi:hypothetical protein